MDKSYNDIMTQAGRIVTIYPKQLKARYRDAQWVFQIAARVRSARGIDMFTKEKDVKHGLRNC
jgi:hypothetical protein